MLPTIVHIGLPESPFGEPFRAAVRSLGAASETVSIDAAVHGRPVTVRPGEVVWEGIRLLEAGAVLVEAPLFPWPQPLGAVRTGETESATVPVAVEREARSLAVSAVSVAAETRPVWNHPVSAHLAASPAIALLRIAAAGMTVHSWKLGPAREAGSEDGAIVLDSVGRDRWHRPSRPSPGNPALVLDPVQGEVSSVLVAGGSVAGGERHASAAAWSSGSPGRRLAASAVPETLADAAIAAARALGLDIAAVALSGGRPSILFVDAGPDLAAWDDRLGGALAPFLAGRLVEVSLAR